MRRPKDRSAAQQAPGAAAEERLEAIVESAERAAEKVIDDAEEQARGYLAAARERADLEARERLAQLAELSDSLLEEAAALRRQAERLQLALEGVTAWAAEEAKGQPDPQVGRRGHLAAVAPLQEASEADGPAEAAAQADAERGGAPSGARLLATQLAVSGSSREEIAGRLRKGFGIEDPRAILDAILGPEE